MIRINLLGVERQKTRTAVAFNISRHAPPVCLALILAAAGGTGWWFWTLRQDSIRVDADTARVNSEAARLKSLLVEVAEFETRGEQLQERVQLIESLRAGQGVPVQLLDHISRSLPDMLWLTEMSQDGGAVTLQGRSTTLLALSDFVGNLGSNALLQKPIEIVNSQVEAGASSKNGGAPAPDLISFTVRAQLAGAPPPDPAARKKRRA